MNAAPPTNAKAAQQGGHAGFKIENQQSSAPRHLSSVQGQGLCAQIKQRLSLRDAASLCGITTLPPRDNVKFRSPLRPDKSPSCTIYKDKMKDWSTGESFDSIGLYAAARGIDMRDAIRELAAHCGLSHGPHVAASAAPCATPSDNSKDNQPSERNETPLFIKLQRKPEDEDWLALYESRKLPSNCGGAELAHSVGVLQFGIVAKHPCWIATDASNQAAEARRLDGKLFEAYGEVGERKAHTLKGSRKGWPVGLEPCFKNKERLADLRETPLVLCEGTPDLLACYCILAALPMDVADIQPCAMLGAEARICPEALELMQGREVIILAHGDDAGSNAARRWGEQARGVKCRVRLRNLSKGRDLNDELTQAGNAAALTAFIQ